MKKVWKTLVAGALAAALLVPLAQAEIVSPWAQPEIERAQELRLMSDYYDATLPISRGAFCEAVLYYVAAQNGMDASVLIDMETGKTLQTNEDGVVVTPFSDVWNFLPCIGLAAAWKIVEGRGDGIFDQDSNITRQEAAVMLARAYTYIGGELPKDAALDEFTDADQIADWAKDSVAAMNAMGIMNGMGDGTFAPLGTYSVEQCYITFLRLYENAPVSRAKGTFTPQYSYADGIAMLEDTSAKSMADGVGFVKAQQVDGKLASLVRMDWGGTVQRTSRLYLVYQDGGMRVLDLGLLNYSQWLSPSYALENTAFSEDGKTLTCDLTLPEEIPSMDGAGVAAGVYHFTINVETCQVQSERSDLPQ